LVFESVDGAEHSQPCVGGADRHASVRPLMGRRDESSYVKGATFVVDGVTAAYVTPE
jgi:hypothetical protein